MAITVATKVLRGNCFFSDKAKAKIFATMFNEKRTSVTIMYNITANDILKPFYYGYNYSERNKCCQE